MDNSPRQGEKSELAVASEMVMKGYGVSLPFGHEHQYDLVVDRDGTLYRVQVKTAKQEGGNRYYIQADADRYDKKYVDLFAGYSEDKVATFFIPVDEASGKRQRVTFTNLEKMGSDRSRRKSNHISEYRFSEAVKRV
ncbi:group I intron-associated PD-(D/E)XK endonuclease [Halomicrobium salinisoli]|uniref:group I intron-associated PD-(D/E)XK endonuclease n=1 Tax=Halomicrobium salinisoli TaxID=2878391 RepID=UPI001CF0B38B|nr:group I intron-associated PD-(D/E)XK endonuclease [Halomicrobium salinisoli]